MIAAISNVTLRRRAVQKSRNCYLGNCLRLIIALTSAVWGVRSLAAIRMPTDCFGQAVDDGARCGKLLSLEVDYADLAAAPRMAAAAALTASTGPVMRPR